MIIMRVVHPFIAALVAPIPHKVGWVVMALLYALYAADLVVTLFVVAGLRRDLEALEKVTSSLHEVSDALTDLLGTTALNTDQKLDEGRLQMLLARAEARDAVNEAMDSAEEAAAEAAALPEAAGAAGAGLPEFPEPPQAARDTVMASASIIANNFFTLVTSQKNVARR